MQPWKVYVTAGETKHRLAEAILSSGIRAEKAKWEEYKYYPDSFFEPYLSRRRAVGYALYGLLGIGRREVDRMRAQHDRNFVFFDAPVGMIFTIDRRLNKGSWIDHGMFLQSIMIAARARGLHTCPQAPLITATSAPFSIFPRRKWSCAAWRSDTKTRPSRRTSSGPNARRSKSGLPSCAETVEALQKCNSAASAP
jgi:nitroreductase